jgi:hypothetical protein
MQGDLFTMLHPPCGDCAKLGAAIDSGVRYCHGALMWRWASERVEGCRYRTPAEVALSGASIEGEYDA